jgi:nucleoside-diphosphate-sugar epimerase
VANHALVVGATGIIGGALVDRLVETGGWAISGLARHARSRPGVDAIQVDLTDAGAVKRALASRGITRAFICTWSRQATEAENCKVNGAMLRNVLDALGDDALRHVALVTGTKHYLGPFEAFGKRGAETPFRETQQRLPVENFYYVQEDILFEAAARGGFTWSVHRPHTVIGYAIGNVMNMASTLAAYAVICRESRRPFVFPGSPQPIHRRYRRHRRAHSCAAPHLGRDNSGRCERGVQCRQRRGVPVAVAVGQDRRLF